MTDSREDPHVEDVSVRRATFTRLRVRDVRVRAADLSGVRVRGAELVDVEISGELRNVVVNGVDIAPLVEAELNRRMPERARMRPDDPGGFGEAWAILDRLWARTLARAATFPEAALHRGVDGEWSFVQTLRHLARPPLAEVLAVRRDRRAMVGRVVASLTPELLASHVTRDEPGWPRLAGFPLKECLHIVLHEEWEHRLYAERDLNALKKED
ncbi:DinB family protein [Nonomuraea sp. NPDC048881]|uniref:DinB family protein n=1 Tax=Nonomuraea sp. NPDC048881 TaxID=3155030 RepID=UPI0033DB4464